MSAIGPTTGSGDAPTSPSRSNAMASTDRSSPASGLVTTPAKSGDRPAVVVDLSDSSKALLARTQIAQAVADKLDQHIDALKGNGTQAQSRRGEIGASASSGLTPSQATETKREAGLKWGDPTLSDAEFLARAKDLLLSNAADQSWAPEKLQAFRDAVAKGALKFQKASDVPDLNYHTTTTYSAGGMSNRSVRNPAGAVKEALDKGDALAFWSADRGNVYVTW